LVIKACSSVDLPEPVFPAISTCCEVPLPSRRYCRLVAPARPSGTSIPARLSLVHHWPSGAATVSNGTSTRLASLARSPIARTIAGEPVVVGRQVQLSGHWDRLSDCQRIRAFSASQASVTAPFCKSASRNSGAVSAWYRR
jgi:hypothetical protein